MLDVVPNSGKVLRPFSGRPTTGRPMTSNPKIAKSIDSSSQSLKNITESEDVEHSSNSVSSKEKFDFLNSVVNGKQKENFENLIKEEADRIDMINQQKSNLKNINLIETNIDGLYDWKTLFNNSRPLSSYTQLDQKKQKCETEVQNNYNFPVALIDAPPEEVELYIPNPNNYGKNLKNTKNKNNHQVTFKNKKKSSNGLTITVSHSRKQSCMNLNQKGSSLSLNKCNGEIIEKNHNSNCTRPKSMYSPRTPGERFYLSKAFSDYYNEDLKTFSEKFPLLKAKIKVNPKKLQKTLKDIKKQTIIREINLQKVKSLDNLALSKQQIIIAGMGGNAKPLLKSIYRQIHPTEHDDFDPRVKYYKNTAKPLGNAYGKVDYSINDREAHINEFIRLRNEANGNIPKNSRNNEFLNNETDYKLKIETYNEKDPGLQIFAKIREENEIDLETIEETKENNKVISKLSSNLNVEEENVNQQLTNITSDKIEQMTTSENRIKEKLKIEAINTTNSNSNSQRENTAATKRPQTSIRRMSETDRPFSSTCSNIRENSKPIFGHRPMTSKPTPLKTASTGFLSDGYNTGYSSTDFIPVKSLPIRTNSCVPNQTYQKIHKMIQSRKNSKNLILNEEVLLTEDLKKNNFSPSNVIDVDNYVKQRPRTAFQNKAIQNKLNEINSRAVQTKWTGTKDNKVSYIYFNDYIDTTFDHGPKKRHDTELTYFHPLNIFNKNSKYHYSSSNNYVIKKKRKDEMDFIHNNNYYTKKDMNINEKNEQIKKRRIMSAQVTY